LINDPLDIQEIAKTLERAILDLHLRVQAQKFNVDLVQNNYNRIIIKQKNYKIVWTSGFSIILKLNTLHNNFFAKRIIQNADTSFNQ
jgi:hypothetical protein